MPLAAKADLLAGVLNITGTADLTSSGVAFVSDEFNINSPASAQQGDFTALAGTTGTIEALTEPVSTVLDMPDFMTFSAAPNISVTLTFLYQGFDGAAGCSSSPAAPGQICTPALSPLNFQNTIAGGSSVTFALAGVEVGSTTGDTTPITGQFTLPFANQSLQQLLTTIAGGGTETTAFAAEFYAPPASTTPEPSTSIALIMAVGMMVGISLVHRRRSEKGESSRRGR
jgi:hypothetical protein